jgi:CBS-domain-containing membrane protein
MRVGRPGPASQTVAGLMTREVDAIDATSSLETLLGLYVKKGHHHIPVVDAQRRIVGIVTTSDLAERLGWLPVAEKSRRG